MRNRPFYSNMDNNNSRDSCNKKFGKQQSDKTLTQGVVILWCVHGIAYGWHIHKGQESVNDVFSAIITRFPKAPKVIIYDLACRLGIYAMKREPHFFKETKFLIDRFHSDNHIDCGRSSLLKTFASQKLQGSYIYHNINDTVAEQRNSVLKPKKKQFSFATLSTASILLNGLLYLKNYKQIREINKV